MDTITVKNIEDIPPYDGPGKIPGIRFRAARQALGLESWGMNVLQLDPDCSGHPEHHHTTDGHEEVYVVLTGTVVLVANGQEHVLGPGGMARVSPSAVRQLVTRSEGATVLALGGTPGAAYKPSMGG